MADGTKDIVLLWEHSIVICSPLSFRIASAFFPFLKESCDAFFSMVSFFNS